MNVCFLINQVAPGGAPTLLLDFVRNTESPDISYTLCVIEGDRSLVGDFEAAGAEVVDFRARFKFDPRALYRMARFFRSRNFDIIHAHLPYSQTLGRVFGRLGGHDRIVSTQHNVPDNYHPVTRTLERLTRTIDARTVAVSEGVEQAFTGDSARYEPGQNRQWCTIVNGIDVEGFNDDVRAANPGTVRKEWNVDAETIFLNISRYVDAKAQHDLIAAMEQVVEEIPDSHLFIVGWGEREQRLRDEVQTRELEEYITITGKVPTVYEYYALGDVFVSSSIFEGMPIAHLEAMAAELPVVATDIPGVNEVIVSGENGLLVPPETPTALGEAMVELGTADDRNAFAAASYERVKSEFRIQNTIEAYLSLYRELLEVD